MMGVDGLSCNAHRNESKGTSASECQHILFAGENMKKQPWVDKSQSKVGGVATGETNKMA